MDPMLWLLIALLLGLGGSWRLLTLSHREPPARILASDPWLIEARARAQQQLPLLRQLLLLHPEQTLIKLRIHRDDAQYQGQWADVIDHDEDGLTVRTRGLGQRRRLAWDELEDWQVELDDGTIRGGFTVVATWAIHHRRSGRWPAAARRWLPRFPDAPVPGSSTGGGGSKRLG